MAASRLYAYICHCCNGFEYDLAAEMKFTHRMVYRWVHVSFLASHDIQDLSGWKRPFLSFFLPPQTASLPLGNWEMLWKCLGLGKLGTKQFLERGRGKSSTFGRVETLAESPRSPFPPTTNCPEKKSFTDIQTKFNKDFFCNFVYWTFEKWFFLLSCGSSCIHCNFEKNCNLCPSET